MEILFVTHKYQTSIGGMERHFTALYEGLKDKCQTHIISPLEGQSKFQFFRNLNKSILKMVKQHPSIQLIYFNDALIASIGANVKKKVNIPMVATVHGLDIIFPNKTYSKYSVLNLNKLDTIICVSGYTKNQCLQKGIKKEILRVVSNGVGIPKDVSSYNEVLEQHLLQKINNTNKKKKIILSVGRAVKRKGNSWFIRNVLPFLGDDVVFVMVGPIAPPYQIKNYFISKLDNTLQKQIQVFGSVDSDERALRAMMSDPMYNQRFFHLGKLSNKELDGMYRLADLCIMPNIKVEGDAEGFGLVALEAGIRSKLVVAADIDGIPQAIQNCKNGLLLDSGHSKKWIQTIRHLFSNESLIKELGVKAYQFNKNNYTWPIMIAAYLDVFRKVAMPQEHNDTIVKAFPQALPYPLGA